jgi:hypothetical protein
MTSQVIFEDRLGSKLILSIRLHKRSGFKKWDTGSYMIHRSLKIDILELSPIVTPLVTLNIPC